MKDEMMRAWGRAIFFHVGRPLIGVGFMFLIVSGCSYVARIIPTLRTPAPPSASPAPAPCPPIPAARPVEAPTPPVEAASKPPKAPSAAIVDPTNGDRVKKITDARSDLKVGLTALAVRAVTACTEPGEACVDNQGLIDRARALDARLAAALLDPSVPVDWAAVQTVLRAVVDTAMKGAPK